MSQSTVDGHFSWHDLLTTDTQSAGAFFSKIIGWKPQPWSGDPSYVMFHNGEHGIAGLMTLPDSAKKTGAAPHWLTYVSTGDIDATTRLAASLGAKVLTGPTEIPSVGRYAVLQDPQGAVFGLYYSNHPMPPDAPPRVGEFSWHELATTDARGAFAFYQRLFGWQETGSMDMGEMGTYQMFGRSKDGRTLGGLFNKPAQIPGPSAWLAYIKVPDAKKAADAIKKLGAKVINGPMEVPGGDWIAQGLDPQGGMFAVHSSPPAAAAAASTQAAAKPVARAGQPTRKAATAAGKKKATRKSSPTKQKTAAKGRVSKSRRAKPVRKTARRSASPKGKKRK